MTKYKDNDIIKMIGKDTGVNEVVVELVLKDLFKKIVDLADENHEIQFRGFGTFLMSRRKNMFQSHRNVDYFYSLRLKSSETIKKRYTDNQ